MLIKSITIENFLPFRTRQCVQFSTDKDRNVTLVMGDNGAGKTSLAQAFEWCLYGRAPKESPKVINAYVSERIQPGAYSCALVEIELIKNDVHYTVSRRQKYSRSKTGDRVKPEQQEFTIFYKEDGETKHVPANKQQDIVNKLLSRELSHYFFFDGEHVKNMRAEIERGKSSDFAEAVKTILGLQPIASAMEHLKSQGNKASVERWFNRQFDVKGDQDLGEKQRRIETLQKSLERLQDDLERAEDDEAIAKQNYEHYQTLLREQGESEEAQKQVDRAVRLQREAKNAYREKENAFFKQFRGGYYRFLAERLMTDALGELDDEDKIDKGVPSIDDKTIAFLLERGECICGAKIKTGDDAFLHLTELLSYVPPKSLGTYISDFQKECRIRTERPLTFFDDLSESFRAFGNSESRMIEADASVSSARVYLASIGHANVKALREGLNNADQDRIRAAQRMGTARTAMVQAKNEIKELQDLIQSYSVKSAKNREIQECLRYVSYMYAYLNSFYSEHEQQTRNRLEQVVNKFFSQMYDGQLHLELDENYGVKVIVDDINNLDEPWKTSSGQTLAIILAFILGILDIAKSNIQQGETLLQGDTYPLVMDAPLSDFDKTRIGTICTLLPQVAEQVIIIIKDTDGELAEEHMRNQIGKRCTIVRRSDYESEIR